MASVKSAKKHNMIQEVRAHFIEKIQRTENIASFRFNIEKDVGFLAGQFLMLLFDEKTKDNRELNKYLSFSSSPTKDYIEVTKRLSNSRFSQSLQQLQKGDTILMKMPLGNCVFKEDYKKIGFLIGGIGITPVISIIEYIIDKQLPTEINVLYSNRTESDIAFKKELDIWSVRNKALKVVYTVTDCQPGNKHCLHGAIDKDVFLNKISDVGTTHFFIFGPPSMVNVMKNICGDVGCEPNKIKVENFVGY